MQKPKQKSKVREECKQCLKNKRCTFKRSIILFEKKRKINIDCWARRGVMSGLFGYHKTIHVINETGTVDLYFYHMLNEKLDVRKEGYMRN